MNITQLFLRGSSSRHTIFVPVVIALSLTSKKHAESKTGRHSTRPELATPLRLTRTQEGVIAFPVCRPARLQLFNNTVLVQNCRQSRHSRSDLLKEFRGQLLEQHYRE